MFKKNVVNYNCCWSCDESVGGGTWEKNKTAGFEQGVK